MTAADVTTKDDPLATPLGRNIQPDDKRFDIVFAQNQALQRQIDSMRETPPLVLLVNPSNFERSYERIADSSAKARQGNIVHLWTERPLVISCKGETAAQYIVDPQGFGGLTGENRIFSLSYMNLLSLVLMYKNNGMIYADSVEKGSEGIGMLPASVFIYYDNHIYIGAFDDFSIDDTADKPYNMEYSFKFSVRLDIECAEINDLYISPIV
jgi:hypothetical protein